ncbi:MAG: hypothetical protein RLZZ185_1290 [Bacteroidota bacterium]|jgi:hypothetical protein
MTWTFEKRIIFDHALSGNTRTSGAYINHTGGAITHHGAYIQ